MRKTFDAELQELNYEMINMSAAAEDAIDVVTELGRQRDGRAAAQVQAEPGRPRPGERHQTAVCGCFCSSSRWPGICARSRRP